MGDVAPIPRPPSLLQLPSYTAAQVSKYGRRLVHRLIRRRIRERACMTAPPTPEPADQTTLTGDGDDLSDLQ